MGVPVGILRAEKIKTLAGLGARDSHNCRRKHVANSVVERQVDNRNLRPDLPGTATTAFAKVHQRLGTPKLRKNGVIGIEYIGTYSRDADSTIDKFVFAEECLRFIERRHGAENIISARLHLDEATPHVHIIAAPVFANALVVGPFMGNRGILRKLQNDFYGEVSSKFGLARRSENSVSRTHIPMRVLRAQTRESVGPIKAAKQQLEVAVDQLPIKIAAEPVSVGSLLTANGRAAFIRSVEQAANSRIIEVRNRILQAAAASLDGLSEHVVGSVLLREENDAMKRHQIELMREIPLDRVTELYLGVSPKREGYSLVAETDDHKLVITGAKFKDFKGLQGSLGGGAIDLTMHLLGCDFKRAIEVLAADFPDAVAGTVRRHFLHRAEEETAAAEAAPHRPSFEEQLARYAASDSNRLSLVRKYLHEERMLPLPMIDQLIERGDLWANRWGSCVFAHRDLSRAVRGCTIRGTSGAFKQVLGSKKDAWFSIGFPPATASRLILTESPIDALSYEALGLRSGNDAILSTAGQTDYEPFLDLGRPLLLAQDADEPGNVQASGLASAALVAGLYVERHTPVRGKDWNEQLTYERDQQRRVDREIAERKREADHACESALERERRPPETTLPGDRWTMDTDGRDHGGRALR